MTTVIVIIVVLVLIGLAAGTFATRQTRRRAQLQQDRPPHCER